MKYLKAFLCSLPLCLGMAYAGPMVGTGQELAWHGIPHHKHHKPVVLNKGPLKWYHGYPKHETISPQPAKRGGIR